MAANAGYFRVADGCVLVPITGRDGRVITTYDIPISRCRTAEDINVWAAQLRDKRWVTEAIVAAFTATALRELRVRMAR